MNAPPMPEPSHAVLLRTPAGDLLHTPPPLKRFPVTEAPGYAIEVSDLPEPVYLLERPDHTEIPVPMRMCGQWNGAVISGRHFFLPHEPETAMELLSVRLVQFHIGRLALPSGWSASPWLAAASRKGLLRRLHQFTEEFLDQRITRSQALSRAITRAHRDE